MSKNSITPKAMMVGICMTWLVVMVHFEAWILAVVTAITLWFWIRVLLREVQNSA